MLKLFSLLLLLAVGAMAITSQQRAREDMRDFYASLYDCDKLLNYISKVGLANNQWAETTCNCARRLGYYYQRLNTTLSGSGEPDKTDTDFFLLVPKGSSHFVVCEVDHRADPYEKHTGVDMLYSGDAQRHAYVFDWDSARLTYDTHSGVRKLSVLSTHHAMGHRLCHASVTNWSHDKHYWHLECHDHATPEALVAE